MSENMEKLITELAEKLGTTTEHLWGVLLKQALISGITDVIMVVALAGVAYAAARFIARNSRLPTATESDPYPSANWDKDVAGIAWALWGLIAMVFLFFILTSLATAISAFANPEYWALKQIIK